MTWFGRPGRVFVTQPLRKVQWVMAATWSALLSSTAKMRSCMASVGARLAYWIWLKLGARLSEVAWPAARIASLIVQVPVCGSIASFVYFEAVYIRQTASMAPGARADVCGLALLLAPIAAHPSGCGHSKV